MFGGFGDTVAKMTASGFFNWFQLERVEETAGPGETVFRPSGEAFHALVSLVSRAEADGRLTGLSLNVARSFIDDPRQGAFARDIVKSFLEAVSGGAAAVQPLVNEIFFRAPTAPVLMRGAGPQLPEQPSEGFLAYTGRGSDWSMPLPGLVLTFANPSSDTFVVRAEPGASKRGWLSRLLGR